MTMNEFSPRINQTSSILAEDARKLSGEHATYNDEDTGPMPVIQPKPFIRNIGAESPFDTNDTDRISFSAVRRQLGLKALHSMNPAEQAAELNAFFPTTATSKKASRPMHIDGRTLSHVPTRDARNEARQTPSKFVQMLNEQQQR